MKQFVPVPYYVPKPIYKYILRHHYVPVKQVVVKPVPVPYPVKYSKKEYKKSYGYDSESEGSAYYGAASSNSYGDGGSGGGDAGGMGAGMASGGGGGGATSGGYEGPGDLSYSQGHDTATSSSNAVDYGNGGESVTSKYSQSGSGMQPMFDDYKAMTSSSPSSSSPAAASAASSAGTYGSPYGYENAGGLYAAPSTLSPSTVSVTANSHGGSGKLKTSASESYYYGHQQPQQQSRGFYDDAYYNSYASGGRSKASAMELAASASVAESYHQHHNKAPQQARLYAPVYSNDKGQLYSNGQVFPSTLINTMGRGGTMSSYHGISSSSSLSSSSLPSSAASVISAFPAPYASSPYTPSSLTSSVFSAVGPGVPALAPYQGSGLMSGITTPSTPATIAAAAAKKKESFSAELQKKAKKLFTETFSMRGAKPSTTSTPAARHT